MYLQQPPRMLPRRQSAPVQSKPLEFLKGFLRNPREVGSVIPSSRFLTRRVLKCGDVAEPVFGPAETRSGFWNLPPMRIYTFRKDARAA